MITDPTLTTSTTYTAAEIYAHADDLWRQGEYAQARKAQLAAVQEERAQRQKADHAEFVRREAEQQKQIAARQARTAALHKLQRACDGGRPGRLPGYLRCLLSGHEAVTETVDGTAVVECSRCGKLWLEAS